MNSAVSRADWARVSADPDLERDLGYKLRDLDVIECELATNELMFLPDEEEMLREDAFIVASRDDVCDPLEWA